MEKGKDIKMYIKRLWPYDIPKRNKSGEIPLDKEATMRHFGYDPKVYAKEDAGWWLSSDVYRYMPVLKRYEEQLKRGKARIIIDYDPDFSKAILRIEKLP